MKTPRIPAVLLAATFFLAAVQGAEKELLENGEFKDNKRYWNGDLKIEVEGDNNYLMVEAKERKEQSFEQRIKTKDIKDLFIKFKCKTSTDYKGRGIKLTIEKPGGNSTYMNLDITAVSEWKEVVWKFSDLNNADSVLFKVEVREGTGSIWFDDFSITSKTE